ncbi:MAG: glutamate-cysteine ligase family protein [Solirubrobacteraceae bacterium]
MPDPETTIPALNGVRKWPLLQALSANSPFWHSRDSGLASTRTGVSRSVPRTGPAAGLPPLVCDYADTLAEL